MTKRGIAILLCVMFGMMFTVQAQNVDINRVQDVVNMLEYLQGATLDVIPEDVFNNWDNSDIFEVNGAAVSPDANRLAWHGLIRERVSDLTRDVICVHTFETRATFCLLPLDEEQTYSSLSWSSDARYVFFTDEHVENDNETDIWVISVESQLLVNLTEDNQSGLNYDNSAKRDFAPTWDAFNRRLYFFRDMAPGGISPVWEMRYLSEEEIDQAVNDYSARLQMAFEARLIDFTDFQATLVAGTQTAIMNRQATEQALGITPDPNATVTPVPTEPGELIGIITFLNLDDLEATPFTPIEGTLVTTLNSFPAGTVLLDTYRELLNAPTAIDNGGLFMAIALNNENDPSQAGLWLIDLAAGGLIPLLNAQNFISEEPSWIVSQVLKNVAWTPDNTGVLLSVENSGLSAVYNSVYYFDLGSGVLTSVVDYGIIESESAYFSGDLSFIVPDTGVILPDNTLFYFNRSNRSVINGIVLPPPPSGTLPTQVDLGRNLMQQRRMPSSIGYNDTVIRVVIDANLLTIGR